MKKILFVLMMLIFPWQIHAAGEEVYFGVKPPTEKLKFADEFSLEMDVSYPSKYEVLPDTSSADNANFDLLDFARTGEASSGTLKTDVWIIKVQAFDIGVSTFPSIRWNLVDKGKAAASAMSPHFNITVDPFFKQEDVEKSDIRDVYPPMRFPNWLLIILAILLSALAGYIIYRHLERRQGGIFHKEQWHDLRSPYQRAYDRSIVLENSPLVHSGKFKEYYTGLVSVFRLYLKEEFNIDAELFTTRDLVKAMKEYGMNVDSLARTRKFFNRADMVKFAKMRPENAKDDLVFMREILQALELEHTPEDYGADANSQNNVGTAGGMGQKTDDNGNNEARSTGGKE